MGFFRGIAGAAMQNPNTQLANAMKTRGMTPMTTQNVFPGPARPQGSPMGGLGQLVGTPKPMAPQGAPMGGLGQLVGAPKPMTPILGSPKTGDKGFIQGAVGALGQQVSAPKVLGGPDVISPYLRGRLPMARGR